MVTVTRFRITASNDSWGYRIKGALVEDKWTVFFRPTDGEQFPVLYLSPPDRASFDSAAAFADELQALVEETGTCEECGHDHIGKCEKVLKIANGWATQCNCMQAPAIPNDRRARAHVTHDIS